jgi:nicotinate-nucleotide adenylyltransferase
MPDPWRPTNNMRVAFFGGTFDPPHRGHLTIARAATEKFSLDTVLFAPTGRQPLKPGGASASFGDRLAMVELLCAGAFEDAQSTRFAASTLDAPRDDGQPNYTVDTLYRLLAELRERHPDPGEVNLFSVVGADTFLDLRHWRDPEGLLKVAEWIVVSRPGFSLADLGSLALTPSQQAQVQLLAGVHEPASASEVRKRLEAGLDCSAFLTPEILRYIHEQRLYLSHDGGRNR